MAMWNWFWWYLSYSFLGFGLEVAFAKLTRGSKPDRKCRLLLPLCPVYGLGALAILALPDWIKANLLLLIPAGLVSATAVEYAAAWFYERVLGVQFWDYSHLPGNLHGRVCPQFCLAWCALIPALAYFAHPWVAAVTARIPLWAGPAALALYLGDTWYTFRLLRRTGETEALRWYLPLSRRAA